MYVYWLFQSPEEYNHLYDLERGNNYSRYHGYAYDGIWVIAKALEKLLPKKKSGSKSYNSPSKMEKYLRGPKVGKALNDTSFRGVTVSIHV